MDPKLLPDAGVPATTEHEDGVNGTARADLQMARPCCFCGRHPGKEVPILDLRPAAPSDKRAVAFLRLGQQVECQRLPFDDLRRRFASVLRNARGAAAAQHEYLCSERQM